MIPAIVSLLLVVAVSMLITRIAAMALVLTGLSQESARFQARSALSGVGFTTREAESVVNHPVRRRIIMSLMLIGSISFPTVIAALGVSLFVTFQAEEWWWPLLMLGAGLLILHALGRSRWAQKRLNVLLARALRNWTDLDLRDYVALLQLQHGFAVGEMLVEPGDWLCSRSLRDAALSREGVLVLGIQRADGTFSGAPGGGHVIQAGDTLLLYGRIPRLQELDQRSQMRGDSAHREAEAEYTARTGEQDKPGAGADSGPPPGARAG